MYSAMDEQRLSHDPAEPAASVSLQGLFEQLPIGVCRTTLEGPPRFLDANPMLARTLGVDSVADLVMRCSPEDFCLEGESFEAVREALRRGEVVRQQELRLRTRSGRTIWVAMTAQLREDGNGVPVLEGIVEEITERKQTEAELTCKRRLLEDAQRIARLGHWVAYPGPGHEYRELWWSPILYELFGQDPLLFSPSVEAFFELVHPEDRAPVRQALREAEHSGECQVEHRLLRPDGEERWIREIARVEFDALGGVAQIVGTAQDVTEHRRLCEALERQASHDGLTGLYNRSKLVGLLEEARAAYERYATPFALLLFDVDDFKRVNDRWGHVVGDRILIGLARRVQGVLRRTDHLGRWGGEEFVVIAPHTSRDGAIRLAERVRSVIADTVTEEIQVTASIGVATMTPGLSLERLEDRADQAMYEAKRAGRNRVAAYPA